MGATLRQISRQALVRPAAANGRLALLIEDPDLAEGIVAHERATAEHAVLVPGFVIEAGEWDLEHVAHEPHLGVVVLEGFVAVNIWLEDRVASQLVGPGDVLHGTARADQAVPARVSYISGGDVRVAVLDRHFIAASRRWPELLVALHERLRTQEHRLAVHAAIGKLRRVEGRVLAVLWQLGERWGRMGADGIVVPLTLTHDTLGRLAGAERPTVSYALGKLEEAGAVRRREDGAFVIDPDSIAMLEPTTRRHGVVSLGVRHVPEPSPAPPHAPPRVSSPRDPADAETFDIDRAALDHRIAALRAGLADRVRGVDDAIAASRAAAERSRATRTRVRERRRGEP